MDLTASSKQKDGRPMKKQMFELLSNSEEDDDGDIEILSASKATAKVDNDDDWQVDPWDLSMNTMHSFADFSDDNSLLNLLTII